MLLSRYKKDSPIIAGNIKTFGHPKLKVTVITVLYIINNGSLMILLTTWTG